MVSKWLALSAALLTLFAGCADKTSDIDPIDTDPVDGGNETAPPPTPPVNTAPVASLVASAMNGTAPLNVTLTLDGSDVDGDNLTWSLAIGNETQTGDALPATVDAVLEEGNHTITLTVSDGNATHDAGLLISVVSGAVVGPEPLFTVLEMIEGCELCIDSEVVLGEPLGAAGCIGWHLGDNELDCGWVAIPDGYAGSPFSVFSYTSGTIPLTGTDGHPDVEFWDTCSDSGTLIEQVFDQDGDTVTGIIPEGAGCIVAFEFHWPNVGHTVEVSLGVAAHL